MSTETALTVVLRWFYNGHLFQQFQPNFKECISKAEHLFDSGVTSIDCSWQTLDIMIVAFKIGQMI